MASKCDDQVERMPGDLGLVALQIDDNAGFVEACGDFGHAVGAGRMVGAGHHDLAAKSGHGLRDPLVVGGDDDSL